MKFLCDRCKTRYSIGDDRVRGKILKIRCKNCANVITVREGMADPDAMEANGAAGGAPQRRMKPTTMSPPVVTAAPAAPPPGALGAAFASAMTKPPPALEEEWYVSIDGEQEGPYSLTEAQRWIGGKAWDAELHCWSEGFDDWLPVDKVSHFRGLRKKPAPPPAPPGPPPLPRATGAQQALRATGAQPALRSTSTGSQPRVEEEPKPLFAATMASLEKGAAAAAAANGGASTGVSGKLGLPPPPSNGTPPSGQARYPSPISGTPAITSARSSSPIPSVTPPSGQPRYPSPIGGTPALPSIQARTNGTGPAAKLPAPAPLIAPAITTPAAAPAPKLGGKSGPVPRLDAKPAAGSGFEADPAEGATQIESPPFDLEAQTKAEPVASQAKASDAFGRALANAPITQDTDNDGDGDEDDSLSIGEVSRVVNLADLAKSAPKKKATTSNPALSRTGAVAKLNATNSVPRIDVPGASPASPAASFGLPGAAPALADEPHAMAMQPAPPAESHKKGMIILIGVATLLVAGVIIAVVTLSGGDDNIDQGLRRSDTIDTTRPDDPLRPRGPGDNGPGPGSAATGPVQPKNPIKRPTNTGGGNTGNQVATGSGSGSAVRDEVLGGGDALSPDDIDSVSKKYSTGTQRCYMRAQKGVDAITIGNVKSIQATLTVAKDGSVSDVALASHADDNLGKCLINALRGWRFRANPGGRVKFTLAFANQ